MKRKHMRITLILISALLLFSACSPVKKEEKPAAVPTEEAVEVPVSESTPELTSEPTPTPTPTPVARTRFIDHFKVWSGGRPLPIALIYSHENGIYADGILFFTPLKDFIEHDYDLPVLTFDGGPLYSVEYDSGYLDEFSESVSFYQPSGDGFALVKTDDGKPAGVENLEPGDYLMEVRINCTKGNEYYSGAGFVHLIIPGGEQSAWPIRDRYSATPTPVLSPEPLDGM